MTLNLKPLLRQNTSDNEQNTKPQRKTRNQQKKNELAKYISVFGSSITNNQKKTKKPQSNSDKLFFILRDLFKKENELEILLEGYQKQKKGIQTSKQKLQAYFPQHNSLPIQKQKNRQNENSFLQRKNLEREKKRTQDPKSVQKNKKKEKENQKIGHSGNRKRTRKKSHVLTKHKTKNTLITDFLQKQSKPLSPKCFLQEKGNTFQQKDQTKKPKLKKETKETFKFIIEDTIIKNETRKRKPDLEPSLSQETIQPTETKKQITQIKKKKRIENNLKKKNKKSNKKMDLFKVKAPKPLDMQNPFNLERLEYNTEEKKILNSITFFDSDENEIASDDNDFLSTRTKPSKVWDFMDQYFEPFTEETYQFCQPTNLEKEGFNRIPKPGEIYFNSNGNTTQSVESNSEELSDQTEKQKNIQGAHTEVLLQRLLGSLVGPDQKKKQNVTMKSRILTNKLQQLQNSLLYWSNPQDPRFPSTMKNQEQLSSKNRQDGNLNQNMEMHPNEKNATFKELELVGLFGDQTVDNDEEKDEVEERLGSLMELLKKVSQRNNLYKKQLLKKVTEIDKYEKKWEKRLPIILNAEKKYKEILKQSKLHKKNSSHN
ncbi:hypothetical protein M0813_29932 [Anaeramoeba flamelloides]|uniref:Uncharacterized protein n=1 Tax=Anaeramoeba flamelloides TaxID=1746091 RepID=A0ABQ8XQH3_9EUKA|nr:hypothetical protein M0813_29932 [Anaeramoeba flamelloides]